MTDEEKLDFMLYYVFYVPVIAGFWFFGFLTISALGLLGAYLMGWL